MTCAFRAVARHLLLATVAGGALLPAATWAQAPAAEEDEIVVTGYVLQNREAIAAKRRNDRIGEFTSADEIGQQPDYNISDAFRRLPGVTTVFDEDEGRYVGIRGLNPNFTFGTMDGGLLATAERQNRQLNMEAIPTTAVSRLEVIKSRTPDIEGNAIGGIVNLVTRSASTAPCRSALVKATNLALSSTARSAASGAIRNGCCPAAIP
jgi:iron complex outermembrane recepter protein